MDKVNVLIAHYFGRPADADTIAAVDPAWTSSTPRTSTPAPAR